MQNTAKFHSLLQEVNHAFTANQTLGPHIQKAQKLEGKATAQNQDTV